MQRMELVGSCGRRNSMLLGLDVGTSSLKPRCMRRMAGWWRARRRGYATHTPQRGWAGSTRRTGGGRLACIRALLAQPGVRAQDIAGIGIAGQSWAAVLVDKDGHAVPHAAVDGHPRAGAVRAGKPRAGAAAHLSNRHERAAPVLHAAQAAVVPGASSAAAGRRRTGCCSPTAIWSTG